ncbi:hypothetical protein F4808DRAFT_470069 [Astrocystis sublimbata]|nr:hypothetical protein F4808DRAFT_470069 [Astrocystis sublimbata]
MSSSPVRTVSSCGELQNDSQANSSEKGSSDGGEGNSLWNGIDDRLSSMGDDSWAPTQKEDSRAVLGPLAALHPETGEPQKQTSDAHSTDWEGETFVYDSSNDDSDDDSLIHIVATPKKPKYEDRLTRLSYVERLPDLDGVRRYHVELDIDKKLEDGKVRTSLGVVDLPTSQLTLLNSNGLQPEQASTLMNFNNGLIEIKSSLLSGYGVFAVCDLEPYTTILLECELFNANNHTLYQKLDELTEEQLKAYNALYGHVRTPSEDMRTAIWRTNRFSASGGGSVFLVASRFNHACKGRNNVDYAYDKRKKCMVFATKERVTAGSELFIRYGSDPLFLYATWGFRCTCGGCKGVTEEDCKALERRRWGSDEAESCWLDFDD